MPTVLDRHTVGLLLQARDVDDWGVCANEPPLPGAPGLPRAISLVMRLDPVVVRGLRHGPTVDYQIEYRRVNAALDATAEALVSVLRAHRHAAERVPATSDHADNGYHPFAHKTAATQAGLGWIGKTALFVSPTFGPAVRLATVFTDLDLPPGEPVTEGRCGDCRACVDACPAGCGRDVHWRAGMAREELFDAAACRHHMATYPGVEAEICGICIAACPYSLRAVGLL